MGPRNMTAAQIAYWEKLLSAVVAQPAWKSDLERNFLSDDFALGERFKADLTQDYAAMKAVLSDLGLAK
jgi:putative tricarboxylic transport membrane protein